MGNIFSKSKSFIAPELNISERSSMLNIITSICSGVQESRLTDLTREMCTPRFLWIPAQRMHMKTPIFQLAHLGPVNNMECVDNVLIKHYIISVDSLLKESVITVLC